MTEAITSIQFVTPGPDPEDRAKDMVQIMHRIYRELLIDSDEQVRILKKSIEILKSGAKGANDAPEFNRMAINTFAEGIHHGLMPGAAGWIHRVIRKCGKTPWNVVPHIHECAELREEDKTHAHVCGFYAVRIEEGAPAHHPQKLTFPLVSATDGAWVVMLANDIYSLFQLSGSQFVWDPRRKD